MVVMVLAVVQVGLVACVECSRSSVRVSIPLHYVLQTCTWLFWLHGAAQFYNKTVCHTNEHAYSGPKRLLLWCCTSANTGSSAPATISMLFRDR